MNIFNQYRGLRKELYIIFWGRVVTAMGGLIWPMLTLILKNKLGYTAGEVANLMLLVSICQLPCMLIGGKIADKFNKKNVIVICDMVTVIGYILCGILPMSKFLVVIFFIAGVFAQAEWPSYDALVANLSTSEERERAYSLNYMGMNLGLIMAPTLGGLLFEEHLGLAFIISGVATFSSTVLIFFFIKDIAPSKDDSLEASYEEADKSLSIKKIFSNAPVLFLFVICMGIESSLYNIGNGFMMPLSLESLFGSHGAVIFGTMTSLNALTVIIGNPICTNLMKDVKDTQKIFLGVAFLMSGFAIFMFSGGRISFYYLSMIIFTIGEILVTLGNKPYITKRVPSSHRGRMSSVAAVSSMIFQGIGLYLAGFLADRFPLFAIWAGIIFFGIFNMLLLTVLIKRDKRQFPLLY